MRVIRGDRVRQLREEKEWNQTTLAQKAGGMKQTTISDIEKGLRKRPRGVRELAQALETNEDYLWGLTDKPEPVQKLGALPMKIDRPDDVTPKSQTGAITGDAQETNTELSTTSKILYLYGTSSGGAGKMILTERHIDKVRGPGYADNVAEAYYVSICTADMAPAYWPGDELLIYPGHPVYTGRDYLFLSPKVEGEQQTCKLRRLTQITETHWVCTVWAPTERTEKILVKEYPIAQWVEGKRNR